MSTSLPELSPSTAQITIVGLGPGPLESMTLAGWAAMQSTDFLLVRTAAHPCLSTFGNRQIESCDDLYEANQTFAEVYEAIAQRVLQRVQDHGRVVYALPGNPWVGEQTTGLIVQQARSHGYSVAVIEAPSFVESSFAAVGVDLMDGSQVVDAMLLAQQHHPRVEVSLPLLIAQVYARWLASDLKLTLLNAYPETHPVSVIRSAGNIAQAIIHTTLAELDHHDTFDHLTSVYLPPLPQYSSVSDLLEIVAHLRAPEGCPWDREQTLASMRHDLLGECAEVLEAIDADSAEHDNATHIAEEIGDLIMAAALMVQIAIDEGRFRMADAMHSIVTKLIRRHPHVFGDVQVDGTSAVLANWDVIKAQEKAAKGITQSHPLDGVPAALPALEKARQLQSKAKKAGLLDRKALANENQNLHIAVGDIVDETTIGRLLWQVVALAHEHDVNAEDALRQVTVLFREKQG
ncbi:MAG: MazG family protein [Caldilineaceae bacterium]